MEIGRSRQFSKGVGHFERRFQREGASPTNHCWCQKTRVIDVSCGMKISAVLHLVLSQYTRLTDGQTDGQTERLLRQQYRALHYMQSHGKNSYCINALQKCNAIYNYTVVVGDGSLQAH